MKKKKKLLFIIGGLAVILIVVANILSGGKKGMPVNAEHAKLQEIVEEVSASGYIQPQTRVNITSEVTAEIIYLPVKEGQSVSRGDILVVLDTVQLQKDLEQTRFSLDEIQARTEAAKSGLQQAEQEFRRQKQLYENGLTSDTEFELAQYKYDNSRFSYEAMVSSTKQARSMFEKAEDYLSKTKILSPMNGVITYLDAEVGEIAAAQTVYSTGKTLMTISNLSVFEVEVDVDETEINKVRRGQKANIEVDAFPDTVFAGEVVEIGNTAVVANLGSTEQSTNFKVKVLFKDADVAIKPGMSATVDIITNSREKALCVPYSAIVMRSLDADSMQITKDDSSSGGLIETAHAATTESNDTTIMKSPDKKKKDVKGVFVIKDGKVKFVPVETGIADQKNIEIVTGLEEGSEVVVGPFRTLRTLKNGDDVKVEQANKGNES
jgi:HlyD family secretion protein